MDIIQNPYRNSDQTLGGLDDIPFPSDDAARPLDLLKRCPAHAETPLIASPSLAQEAGVANVWIKDERNRMGLGSFKALGAAYVIARDAQDGRAAGQTYVTASAGNHGLSVAAGAAAFGAKAVIFLSATVPEAFAVRLRDIGAGVVRAGETYEESMTAAMDQAESSGWTLLSDTSWANYLERPYILMEGYLVLIAEAIVQMEKPPTHIFLQAGVGGLATACASLARARWDASVRIIVVEPELAPALAESIKAGQAVVAEGAVSSMGRLDCKEPSWIALKGLARDADDFMTISEAEGHHGVAKCAKAGFATTPSGAAGVSGLLAAKTALGLNAQSNVLAFLSEGPE